MWTTWSRKSVWIGVGAIVLVLLAAVSFLRTPRQPAGSPSGDGSARAQMPATPSSPPASQPGFDVAVPAALLVDASTGQVLFEKNADMPVQPASIVKVMTLLVTLDAVKQGYVSLDDPVRVSARAEAIGGSQVYLVAGETFPLEKLMRAISIASANDASVAVAEHVAGTDAAFVQTMNERARELGMTHTVFRNADGLPPEPGQEPTLTTARDVATMARELVTKHPEVLRWTSTQREVFREKPLLVMDNTNHLLRAVEGVDGLKTGHTSEAGFSVVATAERGGRRLIAVTMKAESDEQRVSQTAQLLEFGFRAYRPAVVALQDEKVGELRLRSAQPEAVAVKAARTLNVLTLGGNPKEVGRRLQLKEGLRPPIKDGEEVGWVVATLSGKDVARVPVVTTRAMRPAGVPTRAWRWLRDLVGAILPGAAGPGWAGGWAPR